MESKLREILEQVERGELTPEEGAARMAGAARQIPAPATPQSAPGVAAPEAEVVDDFGSVYAFWKNWWILPLSVGAVIFVSGVSLMAWANAAQRGFWFVCGAFPLVLGAAVIGLSFWSRGARWLHVRIREASGASGHGSTRVAISMPLPTQTIGWALKAFARFIPGLRDQPQIAAAIPELMAALDQSGDPLVVEVNDKNGDEVRVYIM